MCHVSCCAVTKISTRKDLIEKFQTDNIKIQRFTCALILSWISSKVFWSLYWPLTQISYHLIHPSKEQWNFRSGWESLTRQTTSSFSQLLCLLVFSMKLPARDENTWMLKCYMLNFHSLVIIADWLCDTLIKLLVTEEDSHHLSVGSELLTKMVKWLTERARGEEMTGRGNSYFSDDELLVLVDKKEKFSLQSAIQRRWSALKGRICLSLSKKNPKTPSLNFISSPTRKWMVFWSRQCGRKERTPPRGKVFQFHFYFHDLTGIFSPNPQKHWMENFKLTFCATGAMCTRSNW